MWEIRCDGCSYEERARQWKWALLSAVDHARKRGHWGKVRVGRAVDDAVYVLTPWGMERQKKMCLTSRRGGS